MKYVRRTSYDIKDNFIPNLLKIEGLLMKIMKKCIFIQQKKLS